VIRHRHEPWRPTSPAHLPRTGLVDVARAKFVTARATILRMDLLGPAMPSCCVTRLATARAGIAALIGPR
jgi:hypothetical protein